MDSKRTLMCDSTHRGFLPHNLGNECRHCVAQKKEKEENEKKKKRKSSYMCLKSTNMTKTKLT